MGLKHAVAVSALSFATMCASFAYGAPEPSKQNCVALDQLAGVENEVAAMMAVMMAYQREVAKESRASAKTARADKAAALSAKEAKLEQEQRKLAQGLKESQEKADTAMSAAAIEQTIGIVSGVAQMVGSVDFSRTADIAKSNLAKLGADLRRNDALAREGKVSRLPAAEAERLTQQLGKAQQDLRRAKTSARPC